MYIGNTMKTVTIDASKLLPIFGNILPGTDIEIELLSYLSFPLKDDTISVFTNKVLKTIYRDDVDRDYNEITDFYNEKNYINRVYQFIELFNILVNRSVDPTYILVEVNSILEYTKTTLKVRLNVYE